MALDWEDRPETPELSEPNSVIFFLLTNPGAAAGTVLP